VLADLRITQFLEETAAGSALPGGGSVAALGAALAAGLSEMVANLTMGKKGYEASEADMRALAESARRLRNKLTQDIDRDSEAYAEVLAAFRLPRITEDDKRKRQQAIQKGFKAAASVPLSVAKDALRVMALAGEAVEKGNRLTVTDGAVAAMMARSAVLSALYNVRINLRSVKDENFRKIMMEQAKELEEEAIKKERDILLKVSF
jgi:formiminotetrahydrofolate cyclodeaminase